MFHTVTTSTHRYRARASLYHANVAKKLEWSEKDSYIIWDTLIGLKKKDSILGETVLNTFSKQLYKILWNFKIKTIQII